MKNSKKKNKKNESKNNKKSIALSKKKLIGGTKRPGNILSSAEKIKQHRVDYAAAAAKKLAEEAAVKKAKEEAKAIAELKDFVSTIYEEMIMALDIPVGRV